MVQLTTNCLPRLKHVPKRETESNWMIANRERTPSDTKGGAGTKEIWRGKFPQQQRLTRFHVLQQTRQPSSPIEDLRV